MSRVIQFREHGIVVEPDTVNEVEQLRRQLADERARGEELRTVVNRMLSELNSRWWLSDERSHYLHVDDYQKEVEAAFTAVHDIGTQALRDDCQRLLPDLRYRLVKRAW